MPTRSTFNILTLSGQLITASPAGLRLNGTIIGGGAANVASLNGGTGAILLTGAGATTVSVVGQTITVSSSAGAGSVSPLCVPFNPATSTIATNAPAAAGFFNANAGVVTFVNLAPYTGYQLVCNKLGVAGAVASAVYMGTLGHFSTTPAQYRDVETVPTRLRTNRQNEVICSGWKPLLASARSGVYLALLSSGGDGALDPVFGRIDCYLM